MTQIIFSLWDEIKCPLNEMSLKPERFCKTLRSLCYFNIPYSILYDPMVKSHGININRQQLDRRGQTIPKQ